MMQEVTRTTVSHGSIRQRDSSGFIFISSQSVFHFKVRISVKVFLSHILLHVSPVTPESGPTGQINFNDILEFIIFWNIIKKVVDSCCTRQYILTFVKSTLSLFWWQRRGSLKRRVLLRTWRSHFQHTALINTLTVAGHREYEHWSNTVGFDSQLHSDSVGSWTGTCRPTLRAVTCTHQVVRGCRKTCLRINDF